MNILVTGVSGYIGSIIAPRLTRDGHAVRGFARHPERVNAGVPVFEGDAVSGAGLDRALEGIEVAYFLIHSMDASGTAAFSSRERTAAHRFAAAASAAGVKRIVYLGGLIPAAGPRSAHLASRLAVEQILLEALPASVALRASIVIGARSRSFRFLVRLVERLPVLALPGWRDNATRPVDERDIIELLARCAISDAVSGLSLDVGGPEVVSYGGLVQRIGELMLIDRPTLKLGRFTVTPIAGRIAALIADEEHELIGPLMESLHTDLLPRDDRVAKMLKVRFHSLDASIEHSLRDWEAVEPLAAR